VYETIVCKKGNGIARVTFNRPPRLNAMTWRMVEEILAPAEDCAADESVRVLAFSGAGRAFSSGDDIVDGMGPRSRGGNPEGITADRGLHYEIVRLLLHMPKLPRLIGQSRAMDLLMTGRVIDAIEAERIGYFNRVWPAATYAEELDAFLADLASGPTKTYAAWKLSVNRSVLLELDSYTDYERHLAGLVRQTEDHTD
jgi:2-(1,2-epoxy-1,2-dihydrophenyl)acetyl-CoA isomerase